MSRGLGAKRAMMSNLEGGLAPSGGPANQEGFTTQAQRAQRKSPSTGRIRDSLKTGRQFVLVDSSVTSGFLW